MSRKTSKNPAVPLAVAVVSAGLLSGATVAILVVDAALAGHPQAYLAYHQATTVPLTVLLPPLGAALVAGTATALFRLRGPGRQRSLLIAALACGVLGMLVTVVVHFPINAAFMSMDPAALPDGFHDLAVRWLAAHGVRSVLTVAAFAAVVRIWLGNRVPGAALDGVSAGQRLIVGTAPGH